MKIKFLIIFLFCIVTQTYPQHGVGPNWDSEVLLPLANPGAKQRGVLYNNIVTTSNGRIIISTTEVNSSNINMILGHYLTYSDDGGITWLTPPQQFNPPNLVVGGSSVKLAMDSNDTLYVLWTSKNPEAIFISKLDKNLNIIKDSIRVSAKVTNYTNSSFATHFTIDRHNRIHVMWHEGNPNSPQTAESFYTRSIDGGITWQTVDTLSTIDGHHSAFPHAEFDVAGDTLAIAWRDSVGGTMQWDVYGVVSTNGGQTWSNPVSFVSTSNADWDPDLLVDNHGRFHLAYHVYPTGNPFWGARVEYRYSDDLGTTWLIPSSPSSGQLSQSGMRSQLVEGFRYDVQRNVLWITWKDERDFNLSNGEAQADMTAVYSTDRGLNWSSPEFVTDRYESTIAFKAGAILPNGDFCVNYEVISPGNINDPSGFLRVYFRKRQSPVTSIVDPRAEIPSNIYFYQNYPNPFNSTTTIRFALTPSLSQWERVSEGRVRVTLKVFDVLGREV
ncbi:MAG: sialidase family protein, partial [Caldisericum exile]|uniref:sialidase family protein n=1 Tax=Caldisericum exile TaxID=693075 RepID=UPI003C77BB07